MQARQTGEQRFSNSFPLVQGGRGFVLYTPLYLRDARGERQFDGFLQGVFRVEPLMDQLLTQLDNDSFSLRLLENGQSLYSRERPGTLSKRAITVPLRLLNNASFSLQLSPTEHLLQQLSTPLPQVVLGGGLAISLLLVAALGLALENARRAGAMQQANRDLQAEATRREEIERHLRDSRERLQLVLDLTDSSRDSLFIFDTRSRELLHMNQATYADLGYRAEQFAQLLRDEPEKLLPGFHSWLELVRHAQRDNQSRIFQRELIRRDGSRQPAEINTQLVQQGEREYLIAVSRDNRERLELEARLQRLSQLDGLTGLYNRRFFDQQLHSEWRRLRRIGGPLALLMVDIDHFKAYNDSSRPPGRRRCPAPGRQRAAGQPAARGRRGVPLWRRGVRHHPRQHRPGGRRARRRAGSRADRRPRHRPPRQPRRPPDPEHRPGGGRPGGRGATRRPGGPQRPGAVPGQACRTQPPLASGAPTA